MLVSRLRKKRYRRNFFLEESSVIAQAILGDYLVYNTAESLLVARIVETESYPGIGDDASHTFAGKKTARTSVLYKPGGLAYVYLIYGRYYCFNIVTAAKNNPQSVFIRALEPIEGVEQMRINRRQDKLKLLTSGPCRWTQAFGINKSFYGKPVYGANFFIYATEETPAIARKKRVGVDYAHKCRNSRLRFYVKGNRFISCK
jgi:DNA-3-methyladenine glycosylase